MRSALKLAVVAGAAAALAVSVSSPAFGDPPTGVTPNANDIVGVGSDTTQFFMDQISLNYDNTATPPARALYSWDATGTSPIVTKTGATSIPRPDGSGAGITALVTNTIKTVDFARSSRGRGSSDPATVGFVAFGKDAVSVAVQNRTDAPANLTTAQLQGIYTCSITNWNQVGGNNSAIQPFLPQSGSGTRSFFEAAMGLTDAQIGPCVTQGVQENEGLDPQLQNRHVVVPYSVAKYIAQVYHSGAGQNDFGTDDHGTLKVLSLNSTKPTKGVAPKVTINPNFSPTFQRVVYNVIRKTSSGDIPAYLKGIFGPTGYICSKGRTVTKNYGFLPLPTGQCGTVS
jgi:ABC-type phosphate transport system substrate-binding protein